MTTYLANGHLVAAESFTGYWDVYGSSSNYYTSYQNLYDDSYDYTYPRYYPFRQEPVYYAQPVQVVERVYVVKDDRRHRRRHNRYQDREHTHSQQSSVVQAVNHHQPRINIESTVNQPRKLNPSDYPIIRSGRANYSSLSS